MENLQVFKNSEFGEIGVITIDGKEYFPAKACAKILGYKDTTNAIKQHCKGVVKRHLPTAGGQQEVNFIPEGDLYRLVARSKLPAAEKFERWVFDEVLVTIRRQGAYVPDLTAIIAEMTKQIVPAIVKVMQETRPQNIYSAPIIPEPPRRRRSFGKVDRLPEVYREAVDQMLEDGFSYREIAEFLAQRGHIMSQMAIHTYATR